MASNVRSLAPIDLRGSLIFGKNLSAFPLNPLNGQMELVNGALWVYTAIDGISTWYPLTNKKNSYVHSQGVDSFQWTVYHGLNTPDVLFGVYGTDGSLQYPSYTPLDNNSFRLNFTSAVSGRCVVFADSERFASNLSTNALLAASIDISNGTVTAGPGGLAVNGNNVATLDGTGVLSATQVPNVPWAKVTATPTTLAGFGITDAVNSSEVVTVATPSKLLKLDSNSKLPASITGNADGNAATASKLQTPRTINGVSFDGSANITINAVDSTARIASSEKAAANGVATLDAAGNVPFAQLGNVVSTAPVALNTLAKLATALNNDPNAYATLTGLMDSKVATAKSDLIGTASSSLNSFGEVEAAISAEEAARIAGDTVLQSNIDALDAGITAQMGAANGIATLGSDGKVPAPQLPSYVDDVLEFANLAGFPASGSSSIIYVTQDTNKTYRWSGSAYVEISASPGSTDSVPEGTVNKYYTAVRARADVTSVTGNAGTATKLATARTLGLSGDASGSAGFDGSANATITVTLANSGVTTGSYAKVTVDAKGRVTAGATLTATDIPSLDWSKLTSGKPTTLAGYGITDAAPLASPALSGVPTAPTAPVNTNTTQIATTAFVVAQIAANGGADAAIDGGTF